jgi:hypothetical protein
MRNPLGSTHRGEGGVNLYSLDALRPWRGFTRISGSVKH